ncbi:MAG: hypothetical protein AB7P76_07440 [Candidatus Melainabacteria bacterium]
MPPLPAILSLEAQVAQSVRDMDRYLRDREYLAMMGFTGANQVLAIIQTFNEQVAEYHTRRFDVDAGDLKSLERAILAGCRLSADLMESLQERLMDTIQQGESDIERLHVRLREQVKARHQAVMVMQKVQSARQAIQQSGEGLGLGVIL